MDLNLPSSRRRDGHRARAWLAGALQQQHGSLARRSRGRRRPQAPRARAGSRACFRVAANYLGGFGGVPRALVVGNHDLEGDEFETDAANLDAWAQARGPARACTPLLASPVLRAARKRPRRSAEQQPGVPPP